ncbi:MAG: hypothetical protein IKN65_06175 [Clostridia bacterium]|nr:hypothetical protein [Clostridia bacterium]
MFLVHKDKIINTNQIKYIDLNDELGWTITIFFITGGYTCMNFETEKERNVFCQKMLDRL